RNFGGAFGHTSPVSVVAHYRDDDSRGERLRGDGGDSSHQTGAHRTTTMRKQIWQVRWDERRFRAQTTLCENACKRRWENSAGNPRSQRALKRRVFTAPFNGAFERRF